MASSTISLFLVLSCALILVSATPAFKGRSVEVPVDAVSNANNPQTANEESNVAAEAIPQQPDVSKNVNGPMKEDVVEGAAGVDIPSREARSPYGGYDGYGGQEYGVYGRPGYGVYERPIYGVYGGN
uniref:Uncharacterized protein n=1 Tax=Cacopsylla melanoneura TaxID=428564 RepID=A0A8D9B8K0_9HEMI